MPERSDDWLSQAKRDLEQARWSLEGEFYEWACFVSQQAAEKAVKACYQRFSAETRGHSVRSLLQGLQERANVPDDVRDCGRKLDRHYVPARYPNGWDSGVPKDYYGEDDAREAVACAERVIRFCDGLLAGPGGGDPEDPAGGGTPGR
jgi:HEPN domain-containing protein